MLAMTGRVTMLGISRWAGKGGSYRTIQCLYTTALPWAEIFWMFFRKLIWQPEDEYILAGDEVVVSKAGEATFGKDCIFSSIFQRAIPGLVFFAFSLVNVRLRRSSPIKVEQVVRSAEEKAAYKAKAQARQVKKKSTEKRKPGRPKGSKNKTKQPVELNPELKRIQVMLQTLLKLVGSLISLKYIALDGHFGNYPSACMVR
jgi:DDE superfamily endonuclease